MNIPLLNTNYDPKKKFFDNETKLYLKGPLGLGIGFKADTINDHIILIENEGIVPFVDFLELIYQRSLIEHLDKKDHPYFNQEYFYYYNNGAKFLIYWEISKNFEEAAGTLGLNTLNNIAKIYSESDKILKILPKIIVSTSTKKISESNLQFIQTQLTSLRDVKSNLQEGSNDIKKYVLSGS